MKKFKSVIIGLIISLLGLLITYLVFGLAMDNFYLWGVLQLTFSVGCFAMGWISSGFINTNIRRRANDKLADTSFKNPVKAEYKTFIFACYFACLFGMILNVIGYYAFGMGKVVIEPIMTLF